MLWVAAGVKPQDVWDEMDRRERAQGIAEKLPKSSAKATAIKSRAVAPASDAAPKLKKAPVAPELAARRPIVARESGRLKKRR